MFFDISEVESAIDRNRERWRRSLVKRTQRYAEGRARLIEEMGSKCVRCGETECLEFHHTQPRTWVAARVGRWTRLEHYRREWLEGVLVLLCGPCNKREGKPVPEGECSTDF